VSAQRALIPSTRNVLVNIVRRRHDPVSNPKCNIKYYQQKDLDRTNFKEGIPPLDR
jgi:hypothetical protein